MELPFSDHVRGLDPSQGRLGRMEGLEAKHRGRDPLYEAMVLFNDVVEVFDLEDLDRVAWVLSQTLEVFRLLYDFSIRFSNKQAAGC